MLPVRWHASIKACANKVLSFSARVAVCQFRVFLDIRAELQRTMPFIFKQNQPAMVIHCATAALTERTRPQITKRDMKFTHEFTCRWWWYFLWAALQPVLCGWIAIAPPVVGNWCAGGFTMINQFRDGHGNAMNTCLTLKCKSDAMETVCQALLQSALSARLRLSYT